MPGPNGGSAKQKEEEEEKDGQGSNGGTYGSHSSGVGNVQLSPRALEQGRKVRRVTHHTSLIRTIGRQKVGKKNSKF